MNIIRFNTLHRPVKKANRPIVKRNYKFNARCARQSLLLITHLAHAYPPFPVLKPVIALYISLT